MNLFHVTLGCLLVLSVVTIGVVGSDGGGSPWESVSSEEHATLLKSFHEAASEVELSTDASVSAHFAGSYPYSPDAAIPGGGFRINLAGTARFGAVDGVNYNCGNIIRAWNPIAEKMFGVVLYRATGGGGAGEVHGLWTFSGAPPAAIPADPLHGTFAQHGYAGNGDITDWERVDVGAHNGRRIAINNLVQNAFAGPRKCFATAAADATCRSDNAGIITRTFTSNGVTETGYPAGSCALAKLAIGLLDRHIPASRIICAAEVTGHAHGWDDGRSNNHPHDQVLHPQGDIVASCVTCQQAVPMLLTRCVVPAVAAPNALGTCTNRPGDVLLEGETCDLSCSNGYSLTTAATRYTCTGGVAVASGPQTCTGYCTVPPALLNANGGCAGGVRGADGRLTLGQTCTWTCANTHVPDPAPATQTCAAAALGAVPALTAAPTCRLPRDCKVPAIVPANTSPGGALANGGVPPRCVPRTYASMGNPPDVVHGVGCQFSCVAGGSITPTCNDGTYALAQACPIPPPAPVVVVQQQVQQQAPLGRGRGGPVVVGGGGRGAVVVAPPRGGAVVGGGRGRGAGAPPHQPQAPAEEPWQEVRRGRRGRFRQLAKNKNRAASEAHQQGMDQGILQP